MITKQLKLKNGVQIIIVRNADLKSITTLATFCTNSRNKNNEIPGISHFIEHLITKNKTLNKKLDILGGVMYGDTFKEITNYSLKVLKNNFEDAFKIFITALFKPIINQEIVEIEKKIIQEEIREYKEDNLWMVDELLENLMYPNTFIEKSILGTSQSISKLTLENIKSYYLKYYTPNNLTICVIGNISPIVKKEITSILRNVKQKKIPLKRTFKNRKSLDKDFVLKEKNKIEIKGNHSTQTIVAIGFKGFNYLNEKKYILRLISMLLTKGYNSRLFLKIREEEGLVYYLDSFCVEYRDRGYLEIKFSSSKKNLSKILGIICQEITILKQKKIKPWELKRVKTLFKSETALNLENPEDLADYITEEKIVSGKNINIEKLFDIIDKIQIKDVKEIASQILTKKNMNIAIIGDLKNKLHTIKNSLSL